jgi:bla regulator protein blaR1
MNPQPDATHAPSSRGRWVKWTAVGLALAAAIAAAVGLYPEAMLAGAGQTAPVDTGNVPGYYPPSQLDKRPYLLTRVDPAYPRIAPPNGGLVVMRLLISEEGKVERMIVVKSEPAGTFDAATMAAFRDARYSPGIKGGAKVKSQIMIEMKFNPILPPKR